MNLKNQDHVDMCPTSCKKPKCLRKQELDSDKKQPTSFLKQSRDLLSQRQSNKPSFGERYLVARETTIFWKSQHRVEMKENFLLKFSPKAQESTRTLTGLQVTY